LTPHQRDKLSSEESAALGTPGDSKFTEELGPGPFFSSHETSARINKDLNIALLTIATELKTAGTPASTGLKGSWALMNDKSWPLRLQEGNTL
jgi:hypothetical protein